ncbi:Rab-GAP TBC domain-containing protein [Plasmodiophora brassicae]
MALDAGIAAADDDAGSASIWDGDGFDLKSCGARAMRRGVSSFRSIHWRVFLGVYTGPPASWPEQASSHRRRFQEMLDACTANPADNASITDLSLNNPLSTAQQSPWSQFFADADLSEVIKMDLVRTHPSEAFFQDPDTQARMLNVLFVWCKQHRDLSYRQGMNEIVAPILQQVQHDAEQQQQAKPLATLCDPAFVEHDAYAVFSALMERLIKMYQGEGAGGSVPCVVARSEHLQDQLLRRVDPDLHAHLRRVDLQPQLYGLRWFRLMLAREFTLSQIPILWDAILGSAVSSTDAPAPAYDLPLLDCIAVAMLCRVRNDLLSSDSSSCVKRLLSFPAVSDVRPLIAQAIGFLLRPTGGTAAPAPVQRAASPEAVGTVSDTLSGKGRRRSADAKAPDVAKAPVADPTSADSSKGPALAAMFHEFADNVSRALRPGPSGASGDATSLNVRLGERLAVICNEMQVEILQGSDKCDQQRLLHYLAQVKQVKDVLLGTLPSDAILSRASSQEGTQHPLA